jgi:hypothetical protein
MNREGIRNSMILKEILKRCTQGEWRLRYTGERRKDGKSCTEMKEIDICWRDKERQERCTEELIIKICCRKKER